MIRKSLLLGGAALMLVGCGRMDPEAEFRAGLPSKEMVEVKAPNQSGQGLVADVGGQSTQGGTSDFYLLTRGASVFVNGGTLVVLGLLDGVTKHQPTSMTADTAVWGPHTEALARNTWKLTVKKVGDLSYEYVVEAKAKEAADSEFKAILRGAHTASADEAGEPMRGFGSGNFTIDWDAAQTLPEHDNNIGSMTVRYSRVDTESAVTVEADFRQVKDAETQQRIDADYRYRSTPGTGGELQFGMSKDWYTPSTPSAKERLTIKSRWLETGAGRSDVKLSEGDLMSPATYNECWDTTFASRFARASYAPAYGWGQEATDCAFTSAEYSSL